MHHILLILFQKIGNSGIDTFITASFNGIRNCSHMEKLNYFTSTLLHSMFFFLFASDDGKTNDLEPHFYKVFRYKCFCKNTLLQRYLLERIKNLVRHLQFMIRQKHNLLGHLILPRIFPLGQNVRCVFRLVGQFFILTGHCLMSDRYFKACSNGPMKSSCLLAKDVSKFDSLYQNSIIRMVLKQVH